MATTSEASRLQKAGHVMRFIGITVGLLAMLGASACGVGGVDDPEGQQAAYGTSGQALLGPDGMPINDTSGGAAPGGAPVNPSISSLPTDPVPWHNPTPKELVDQLGANAQAPAPMPTK